MLHLSAHANHINNNGLTSKDIPLEFPGSNLSGTSYLDKHDELEKIISDYVQDNKKHNTDYSDGLLWDTYVHGKIENGKPYGISTTEQQYGNVGDKRHTRYPTNSQLRRRHMGKDNDKGSTLRRSQRDVRDFGFDTSGLYGMEVIGSGNKTPIYLLGLFPFNGSWAGGLGQLPAIEMGINDVNKSPDILADYTLYLTVNNTAVSIAFICILFNTFLFPLQWRNQERNGVSNHQPHDCLLKRLFSADQRKHQNSVSLAFLRGIHRSTVNSPHKGPVARKMFRFDDVIMYTQNGVNAEANAQVPCHVL